MPLRAAAIARLAEEGIDAVPIRRIRFVVLPGRRRSSMKVAMRSRLASFLIALAACVLVWFIWFPLFIMR